MILAALLIMAEGVQTQGGAAPEKPACTKPVLLDRPNLSAPELKSVMDRAQAYLTCMSAAIEAQRSKANDMFEHAKAEGEKSNAMVTDVNAFVAQVKAYQSEHSGN